MPTHQLHPDAAAVASPTWSPDAPNIQSGIALLTVRAKTQSAAVSTDHHKADAIANALITDAHLVGTGRGVNDVAARRYHGSGLTPLAIRRG